MSKKIILGLISFTSLSLTFATNINPVCQNAYYKGVVDTFLFEKYQNDIQVPREKYWVVMDVSNLTNADRAVMVIKLKEKGYNPVLVETNGRVLILAYASNSYSDAKGVAQNLPIGRGEVIQKPKYFEKIYFSQICQTESYTGMQGMRILISQLEKLARKNLDAVKYAEFEKHLKALKNILEQRSSTKIKSAKILERLFGGE